MLVYTHAGTKNCGATYQLEDLISDFSCHSHTNQEQCGLKFYAQGRVRLWLIQQLVNAKPQKVKLTILVVWWSASALNSGWGNRVNPLTPALFLTTPR